MLQAKLVILAAKCPLQAIKVGFFFLFFVFFCLNLDIVLLLPKGIQVTFQLSKGSFKAKHGTHSEPLTEAF